METEITKCDSRDNELIDRGIVSYNAGKVPFTQADPFMRLNYKIEKDGALVAGVKSVLYCWGCLYVDVLYVDPNFRNKGYGTRLLKKVEDEAKKHGCHLIHLDTFDFQAKGYLYSMIVGKMRSYLRRGVAMKKLFIMLACLVCVSQCSQKNPSRGNNDNQGTGINTPPVFSVASADMKDSVSTGLTLVDTVRAIDANGDSVQFAFLQLPNGMSMVDSIISWTPLVTDTGIKTVVILATDGRNGSDTLTWTIQVSAPVFSKSDSTAPFPKRFAHAGTEYANKVWAICGDTGTSSAPKLLNDVWYSANGGTWVQATQGAAFSKRRHTAAVSFNGKLWVLGGNAGSGAFLNDVWNSSDGVTWTQVTAAASFSKRHSHAAIVFKGKMWVVGGWCDIPPFVTDDVWYSTDGISWTQATDSAGFAARYNHTCVVLNETLILIGGTSGTPFNDVWSSADGITWQKLVNTADFSARYGHSSAVHDGKIWIAGGQSTYYLNYLWYSTDGIAWHVANASAGFSIRAFHTSQVFTGKLLIMGGRGHVNSVLTVKNDVWFLAL